MDNPRQCLFWMPVALCGILYTVATPVQGDEEKLLAEKFFETSVRPLLIEKCYKCHSEESDKGGLRLDSIAAILAGGESGPALVPHKPDESLLIEAVRYESYEMPPDGQLSETEIAHLVKWIELGAPWPGGARDVQPKSAQSPISDEDREFWSFKPLDEIVVPQVDDGGWGRNEIDRFVFAKLRENGLAPSEEAERLTLIRRLYFDLIGLPPTLEQIEEFVADRSTDAYENLVDRLLTSERYGEQQARFWLDLVRYAESDGFRKDDFRPEAWRYRDYVIDAFNTDKPFARFLAEQIAGDEIAPHDPLALAATGFLRHGVYEYNQRDARTQWQDMLNDITDTVGDVFLGVGMGCARCHDHKFDPILQKDYFRLQAFFANLSFRDNVPIAAPEEIAAYTEQLRTWEEATLEIRERLDALERPKLAALERGAVKVFPEDVQEVYNKPESEKNSLDKQLSHLVYLQVLDKQKSYANSFKDKDKEEWEALQKQLAEFDHLKPKPLPTGRTVTDHGRQAPPVFIPSKQRLGQVEPGFLTIFDETEADIVDVAHVDETSGRRSTLARWLTQDDHPLTTRVIVNRIWREHFGNGIVGTPSDFGHLGEKPSHPELLDWLARKFVENNWSLKWLHREIVTSSTYRQKSLREDEQAQLVDPDNRLLWRYNVRRLTAEQIRDAFLSASGELDLTAGGPSQPASSSRRRSIYTRVMRNSPDALLAVFDFPDRMSSTGSRNTTTTPGQSLLLVNGEWMLKRSENLAKEITRRVSGSPESQIREAFRVIFGRDPNEQELTRLSEYLEMAPVKATPRTAFSAMPHTERKSAEIGTASGQLPLQAQDLGLELGNSFTIEATVFLRSLFPDSSVRTIVADWNGQNTDAGWSLGVTSTKSAYKPANLILQFIGQDAAGKRKYEVVPSNLHLELNRPYAVAVSVHLATTGEEGVRFVLKDLVSGEVRTADAKHDVVQFEANDVPLVIGGRAKNDRHRWDGWIGDLRLSQAAVPIDNLTAPRAPADTTSLLAHWTFDSENPLEDRLHQRRLEPFGTVSPVPPAFVDICHVLLNSNEFVYVD